MAISSKDFIKGYRDAYRKRYLGSLDVMSDEAVYKKARKQYPNLEVEDFSPSLDIKSIDTSPKKINGFEKTITDASDYFIDEDSYMIHKYAFNNSMTGLAYKLAKGEDKYPEVTEAIKNGEYSPGMLKELYAGFMAFTFPVDLGIMIGTGGLAGVAGQGLARSMGMKVAKKGASKAFGQSVIEGALGLGGYMGAASTLGEAAMQSEAIQKGEQKKFDSLKIAKSGMEGFLEGSVLGASVGGVATGFSKMRANMANNIKKAGGKTDMFAKVGQMATNKVSETVVEGGVFTGLPYVYRGAPTDEDGNLDWSAVGKDLFLNTNIIGGLQIAFNLGKSKNIDLESDVNKLIESKKSDRETVSRVVKDQDILNDLDEQISKLESVQKEFPKYNKIIKEYLALPENDMDARKKFLEKTNIEKDGLEAQNFITEVVGLLDDSETGIANEQLARLAKEQGIDVGPLKSVKKIQYQSMLKTLNDIQEQRNDFNKNDFNKKIEIDEPKVEEVKRTLVGGQDRDNFNKTFKTEESQQGQWESVFTDEQGKVTVPWTSAPKNKKGVLTKKGVNQLFDMQRQKTDFTSIEKVVSKSVSRALGKVDPDDILKMNIDTKTKKNYINLSDTKVSGLNENNSKFLAYTLSKQGKAPTKGTVTDTIDFMKWVEKTFDKDVSKLTTDETVNILKRYIGDVEYKGKKIDIINTTSSQLKKKYNLDDREINGLKRYSDKIRDNLYPLFKIGAFKDIIGQDIITPVKKFNVSGERQFNIKGGDKGFDKWVKFSKSKDSHNVKKGVNISGEGLALAVDVARHFQSRPGELELFLVKNVNSKTGEIKFDRQKTKEQKKSSTYESNRPDLVKRLIEYKELNKIPDNKPFFGKLNGNDIAKYLDSNSDTKLILEDVLMNKDVNPNSMMDFYQVKNGKLEKVKRKASTYVQKGNVFRAVFNVPDDVDFVKKAAEERGTGIISTKQYVRGVRQRKTDTVTARPKSEIQFGDKQVPRQEFFNYVKAKYKLNDKQLKEVENLGRGKSWGEYEDGKIRLAQGKFEPIDFFHELTHMHEAYVRKVGDKTGIRLYNQLDNIVIRTKEYRDWQRKNPGKDSVEFYTDKVALQKLAKAPKGAGARFRRWLQNLKSNVLTSFLGGKFASQKDILIRLSKELDKIGDRDMNVDMKGSTILIGGQRAPKAIIRYRKSDSIKLSKEEMSNRYHYLENLLIKENVYTKKQLRDFREKLTGHKDWSLENTSKETMNEWYTDLRRLQRDKLPERRQAPTFLNESQKKNWQENVNTYDSKFRDYITEDREKLVLKSMGVKDGNIDFATPEQITSLSSWAEQHGEAPLAKQGIAYEMEMANVLKDDKKWGWVMQRIGPLVAPVHHVMTKLGAPKIGKKLLAHTETEYRHSGKAVDSEFNIKRLIGEDNMNRLSYIVDPDRYKDRLNNNLLDAKDIALHSAIFDKSGKVKNTTAGLAYKEFDSLRKYYWNEILEVAKDKYRAGEITKAELSRFNQDFQAKYQQDYFPRRLTDDFKKNFDPSQKWFQNMLTKALKAEANDQVLKRKYNENLTYKQALKLAKNNPKQDSMLKGMIKKQVDDMIKDPDLDMQMKAELELYNMFEFSPETVKNPYLFKRGLKLPEIIDADGKKIQVYETKYAESMGNYSRTMSRFISTAENFPEFTKMFRDFGYPTVKSQLLKSRIANYEQGKWMLNQVKSQLGIMETDMMIRPLTNILQKSAQITSKIALSFPTAGIKNFIVGTPQTVAAFGPINTVRAMAKNFDADARMTLRKSGAVEAGLKYLDEMKTHRAFDFAFKGGIMKPTENFNRLTAIYAGRQYLQQSLRMLDKKRVKNGLKRKFNLDDAEIDLLKTYGTDILNVKSNPIAEPGIRRALDKAIHKVDTWSHLNTQGGTTTGLVPYWFNAPLVKPFLLFQKMAYAATNNIVNNVIKPMNISKKGKGGNLMPLIQFTFASTVGGYGLMKMYDVALGVQPPNGNDPWHKQIMNYMWKAEMLGIVSETLSPFQSDSQITQSLYPAIYKNFTLLGDNVSNYLTKKKTFNQAFDDSARGILSFYNQSARVYERKIKKGSEYNRNVIALNRLKREYNEAMGIETPSFDNNPKSERSKYYRDFKKRFNQGDMDLAARNWLAALFAIRDSYLLTNRYTEKEASKVAYKEMKNQIKDLEPLNLSKTKKGRVISARDDFLIWLNPKYKHGVLGQTGNQKLYDMMLKTQNEYGYKRRQFVKALKNYVKVYGLEEFYPLLKNKQRLAIQ